MTVDERFDRIDQSFDELKQMIGSLHHKVEALDHRVEALERRAAEQQHSLSGLTKYILDFRLEATTRLQLMGERLDVLTAPMVGIESRFSVLTKGLIDMGAPHTQLAGEQWRLKDTNFDLLARVAKLEEIVSTLVKPAA
jgi:uncharacterized coiled-coil protein SlyX